MKCYTLMDASRRLASPTVDRRPAQPSRIYEDVREASTLSPVFKERSTW
jgi:hypothetical protein